MYQILNNILHFCVFLKIPQVTDLYSPFMSKMKNISSQNSQTLSPLSPQRRRLYLVSNSVLQQRKGKMATIKNIKPISYIKANAAKVLDHVC